VYFCVERKGNGAFGKRLISRRNYMDVDIIAGVAFRIAWIPKIHLRIDIKRRSHIIIKTKPT
jgi:hypothetical protein